MTNEDPQTFTEAEYKAIHDRIAVLEDMRLLGGEGSSVDDNGMPVIMVMPLDDGPPRYVIRKREGLLQLLNGDASVVVATGGLDDILAALP